MSSTSEGNPAPRRYRAFISYRHADNREEGRRWATWLHESLESYEVPRKLVRTVNSRGEIIPESLFPIFRDEEELPADADLSKALRQALENSENLIVICSPRSVQSRFVSQEVAAFKELGRSHRIYALMIAGEPQLSSDVDSDHPEECLPRSLRRGVCRPDGTVDWEAPSEPICADVRLPGTRDEGYTTAAAYRAELQRSGQFPPREIHHRTREYALRLEAAKLKLISGVLGVPFGALTRADNRFRIARLRRALVVVGGLALAALFAAGIAMIKQREADRERQFAEVANSQANGLINDMLYSLGQRLKPLGQVGLLDQVSQSAEHYFQELPQHRRGFDVDKNRAAAAMYRGDVLEEIGDEGASVEKYREAHALLQKMAQTPDDNGPEVQRLLGLCLERLADAQEDSDPLAAAAAAREGIAIHEELVRLDPGNLSLRNELGQLHERLGDILEDSSPDIAGAAAAFERSAAIREELIREQPENPQWQRDLGVANGRLGDLYKSQGRFAEARACYERGLAVRQSLIEKHALNARWQSEIGRGYSSLGELLEKQQDYAAAAEAHQQALRIRRILADFDPGNAKWQGDLVRSWQQLARLEIAREDWESATKTLADARKLGAALVQRPGAEPKIVLDYVSLLQLAAELHRKRNDPVAAVPILEQGRDALRRLREKAAGNAKVDREWGKLSHELGECHMLLQAAAAAAEAFEEAVKIRLTLAKSEDVDSTAELAFSEGRLAQACQRLPNRSADADRWKRQSSERFQSLSTTGKLAPQHEQWRALVTTDTP